MYDDIINRQKETNMHHPTIETTFSQADLRPMFIETENGSWVATNHIVAIEAGKGVTANGKTVVRTQIGGYLINATVKEVVQVVHGNPVA